MPGVEAPSGVATPVGPNPRPAPKRPLPPPAPAPTVPGALATLRGERAIAPRSAPKAVKRVIAPRPHSSTPYIWGGGHARWQDKGYDCSGSVSYALHGGRLLESPLVSGSFMRWGEPGPGKWITIYANKGHVYMVVAGLRWDTGGRPEGAPGPGPKKPSTPRAPSSATRSGTERGAGAGGHGRRPDGARRAR